MVKIAVVSDLHYYQSEMHSGRSGAPPPSFLSISEAGRKDALNPIQGLFALVDKEGLSVDLLLCGGDIGHQAFPTALQIGWAKVAELGKKLNAARIIATPGNHDVDSRYIYNDYDAKGLLQEIEPSYPGIPDNLRDVFWAQNFVIVEDLKFVLLVINSAAYHGVTGAKDAEEFRHGRIATRTINKIRKELEKLKDDRPRIALFHHHPMRQDHVDSAEFSAMKGGMELLDGLIKSSSETEWLVIHGHTHYPMISYQTSGGSAAATVISAGSLSSTLHGHFQTKVRNQFHIIELLPEDAKRHLIGIAGEAASWDWVDGKGWVKARGPGSGLPSNAGFGWRPSPRELEQQVFDQCPENGYIEWAELTKKLPKVRFVTPVDIEQLSKSPRLSVVYGEYGCPHQVQRRVTEIQDSTRAGESI